MLTVESVDPLDRGAVHRFLRLPFRLYAGHLLWVPPLWIDAAAQLNPQRHPFYEHSAAAFFLASRQGQDVGRIAALENRPYNSYHGTRQAQFYLFECTDDIEVAAALLQRAGEGASGGGLEVLVGLEGVGALD